MTDPSNPQTPRKLPQRVRIASPDGIVLETKIEFEDGTPLTNVLRTVISLESPVASAPDGQKPDGKCYAFISQYDSEEGRVVYGVAEALVGDR